MKETKKKNTEKHTPIIDGDARPDKQEDAVAGKPKSTAAKSERQLTKGRAADTDSLEDYKDAK